MLYPLCCDTVQDMGISLPFFVGNELTCFQGERKTFLLRQAEKCTKSGGDTSRAVIGFQYPQNCPCGKVLDAAHVRIMKAVL